MHLLIFLPLLLVEFVCHLFIICFAVWEEVLARMTIQKKVMWRRCNNHHPWIAYATGSPTWRILTLVSISSTACRNWVNLQKYYVGQNVVKRLSGELVWNVCRPGMFKIWARVRGCSLAWSGMCYLGWNVLLFTSTVLSPSYCPNTVS